MRKLFVLLAVSGVMMGSAVPVLATEVHSTVTITSTTQNDPCASPATDFMKGWCE
jgi:hypothetical protein